MKRVTLLGMAAILTTFGSQLFAQIYDTNNVVVQTLAGSGFYGYVDGVGQLTMFYDPIQIVSDSHSNLFVWDSTNLRIRKITPDATVTTFAGGGASNTGVGTNAYFYFGANSGTWMAIDRNDTIWLYTSGFPNFYKITSGALVTVTTLNSSYSGFCVDSSGNFYFSDPGHKIYRYTTNGAISVFAGSGNVGYADGNGIFTAFTYPQSLAIDAADSIYVWDSGNYVIRKIDQSRNVTTLAGVPHNFGNNDSPIQFSTIYQMCFDGSGNLILACDGAVRKISPSTNATTLAGSFTQGGYTNGAGSVARFVGARGVCVSQGMVFVADSSNQRIRQISFNPSTQQVAGASLNLKTYPGLTITGLVGRTYRVESSSSMSNWTSETTLLLNSSPYLWFDQNAVGGKKFYRAFLLP